ncbi:MC009L [Molluscum contagiosum virus subtype 1]|uniref:MC009L n=2 Tax=Molluscum contagiosum virus TaxID=10279 RepID=Q98180_MCV1|nr:MC009L [Molluscum contagiosum virus subtype 1]AZT86295.1 MC009L [Molluscum contagiosum virus]AAC55137.1 MC009L [Molluscum contagiosum virus subtype 1]AQY16748.1 MC009 [Molluscum contagiosum virus subtype 1]AQY17108.1 MC009 [Molluscum contagiosum virus subtype 1]AYO88673.1 MC009 [Molluscum contagiosum virus subtype 1]
MRLFARLLLLVMDELVFLMRNFALAQSEPLGFHALDAFGLELWAWSDLRDSMVRTPAGYEPATPLVSPPLCREEWTCYASDLLGARMRIVDACWLTPESPLLPRVSREHLLMLACAETVPENPCLRVVSSDSNRSMEASGLRRRDLLFVSHTSDYALCVCPMSPDAIFSVAALVLSESNKRTRR